MVFIEPDETTMLRALWTAGLLLGAACSSVTAGEPNEDRGLRLSLTVTQDGSTGPVRLAALLTNTNDHPVILDFDSGCQVRSYVEDSRGVIVHPADGEWVCTAALTELQLGPGQSAERATEWEGGAGTYRAYSTMRAELDGALLELRSEPRTFTVE